MYVLFHETNYEAALYIKIHVKSHRICFPLFNMQRMLSTYCLTCPLNILMNVARMTVKFESTLKERVSFYVCMLNDVTCFICNTIIVNMKWNL